MNHAFVISMLKILHSAMNVLRRLSDWRPDPPTPSSSMLPLGCLKTRVMRATCEIASMNMTSLCDSRFKLCFNSGSLAVVVSCYSLNTVEGIRETSCSSLSRNQGRGAEIDFHAVTRGIGCLLSAL